ncbi:hypothetical protein [Nocardia fluminea]|uniref:hypothetical protein n=1 Tax=Nocardia fluminea TaxID=134984 RepID=UPI003D0E4213
MGDMVTFAAASPAAGASFLLRQQARDRLRTAGLLATAEQIVARRAELSPAVAAANVTRESARAVGLADSRFGFVLRLENSAAFGAAIGAGVTGRSDGSSLTVPARANALVTLLDGLLDDAAGLDTSAVRAASTVLFDLADGGEPACRVETLVGQVAVDLARQVRQDLQAGPGFAKPELREMLQEEVALALRSELATTERPDDLEVWRGKSAHAAAACALAAVTMKSGLSARDARQVRDLMREAGSLVGWLDDLTDFEEDLLSGNGSEVVCILQAMLPAGVPALAAAAAVGTTVVRRAIDMGTQSRIATTLGCLESLPAARRPGARLLLRDACTMAGGFASGSARMSVT